MMACCSCSLLRRWGTLDWREGGREGGREGEEGGKEREGE